MSTHEIRLAEVHQIVGELDARVVERRWVADTLAHFDRVWEALNVINQARLVRAIVEQVLIHGQKGTIEVVLADIDIGDDEAPNKTMEPAASIAHEPAQAEASA